MTRPTDREIAAVSTDPRRFRNYYAMACEAQQYAASHCGKLPAWCWELSECKWDRLAQTLREMDDLAWVRRMVAA